MKTVPRLVKIRFLVRHVDGEEIDILTMAVLAGQVTEGSASYTVRLRGSLINGFTHDIGRSTEREALYLLKQIEESFIDPSNNIKAQDTQGYVDTDIGREG